MPDEQIQKLREPTYTEEEKESVVTHLLALKKQQTEEFLRNTGVPPRGTKAELRQLVEASLQDGELSYGDVVRFLDRVAPWGKQHVFLYSGPGSGIENWRQENRLRRHLEQHRVARFLNASLPLILPQSLRLSSIAHTLDLLRVTAIERREWYERQPDYDREEEGTGGESVLLKGFVHHVVRGLFVLEWNLAANTAWLQITQLPTDYRYEHAAEQFWKLVDPWLPLSLFTMVDLAPAVAQLHREEETSTAPETRSHGIDYRTTSGRRLWGRSATARQPLFGEAVVDHALHEVRERGVAGIGNFYWLPGRGEPGHVNPLQAEIHVIIVANRQRVDFPTPNPERDVRYVLSRIRALCR